MSNDLTLSYDEDLSESVPLAAVEAALREIPGIKPNGHRCYVWEGEGGQRMELDLETLEEPGSESTCDCIRASIAAANWDDEQVAQSYLPVLLKLAKAIGWEVADEQTGERHKP